METCNVCGATCFYDLRNHTCAPLWTCWFDDGPDGYYEVDDGGVIVRADRAREAAEIFTERNAGSTMDTWSHTIIIKTPGDEWFKVNVSAEINWYANCGEPEPFEPQPCRVKSLRSPTRG